MPDLFIKRRRPDGSLADPIAAFGDGETRDERTARIELTAGQALYASMLTDAAVTKTESSHGSLLYQLMMNGVI